MKRWALLLPLLAASTNVALAQAKPIDLTLGWNYIDANEGDGFANLNGWYGSVNWEFSHRVGLTVVHESVWGQYNGIGTNQHIWLGGATVKLLPGEHRMTPFVQPLGGVTRNSYLGVIEQQPTFQVGGGADILLRKHLALEVIPGIYVLTHADTGTLSNYEAAAGLQYIFGH